MLCRFAGLLQAIDNGVEYLADFVDQARNGGVRAHGVAIAATRAVLIDITRTDCDFGGVIAGWTT